MSRHGRRLLEDVVRRYAFVNLMTVSMLLLATSFAHSQNKAVEDELKPVKGDDRASDIRALKTELLVSKTEDQAMSQLNKLLARYRGTGMEAGLWQRKAELYLRMSKTERFFELSRDSETVVSAAPQRVKSASSKKYLSKAVDMYDMIQRKFPRYEQLDLVIFNNAFTRQQLDQNKLAENLYRDLLARFPNSELIPDSHLALGEMLFERKDFAKALIEFNKIKNYPTSRVYPYGLYKAGWAKYNLRDTGGAIKELEAVVAFGKRVEKEGLDGRLDLRAEALSDMVLFFSDMGEPSKAYAYFKEQAGESAVGPYLLKLAALYVRHSKHTEHERVLRDLIGRNPTSPSVPDAYEGLVENYENQRKRSDAVAALKEMDVVCDAKGSWAKANKSKDANQDMAKVQNSCLASLIALTLKYSSKWNRTWKKNPTYNEFADSAEAAYQIYLKHSFSSDESFETRFAYAEMLFQRAKYREASEQYAVVAREVKNPVLMHDSGYASVVSLEKAVNDKWSDADEKKFLELSDVYLKRNKNGKFVTDLRFKRAFIAYEKSRYSEAMPVFEDLGFKQKQSAFSEKSQNLYLDILNIKKDYGQLREFSGKLLKTGLSEARTKQVRKVFEEASFAEAQSKEESGEYVGASESYERFAIDNPTSALADKSYWNAISLAQRSGQINRATKMAANFGKQFPKSEFTEKSLLLAAQGYESMLQLKSAASVLIELASKDHKNELKWKTLAADFYALSGERVKAEALFREMTRSKDLSVSQGAYAKLVALNTINGQVEPRILNEIIRFGVQPQASLATAQVAENLFEEGKYIEAFKTASDVIEAKKYGASQSSLGRARLVQARILQSEFVNQSVKSRVDRLATVLQLKTGRLEKAQQAFQDVVRYGDPKTSVAALTYLSESYGHYVDSLRKLEIVGDVKNEEIQALRKELESLAMPIEDKRVDVLNEALNAAKRLELRDGSIAKIQMEINRLNMKRAPSNAIAIQVPPPMLPKQIQTLGGR